MEHFLFEVQCCPAENQQPVQPGLKARQLRYQAIQLCQQTFGVKLQQGGLPTHERPGGSG